MNDMRAILEEFQVSDRGSLDGSSCSGRSHVTHLRLSTSPRQSGSLVSLVSSHWLMRPHRKKFPLDLVPPSFRPHPRKEPSRVHSLTLTMPRIPRVRGLSSLQSAVAPSTSVNRIPFAARAAALSTSSPARIGKNTEWVRGKLWKGEAPGPEDPYTQRPEPVDESNLPEEALEYQPRRDRTPRAIKESRLALPPKRTEAATEEEIQSVDPSYTPATTIDGLEEIEPLKTWWEQPGHWGEESDFRGFGSADKVQDKAVLEVYLRQALVEALSLQEAGLLEGLVAKKWRPSDRSELDQTLAVDLQVQDGKATLKGDVSAVTGRLTSEAEQPEEVAKISVEEAQEIVKAWDASWKTVTLNDHLKFAVRYPPLTLTATC